MDKIIHEIRLKQCTSIIRECRDSGMSIRAWCLENNVNEKQFYYWKCSAREELYNIIEKTESKIQTDFMQLLLNVDFSKNNSSFMAEMVVHIDNNVLELCNTVSEELLSKVLKMMFNVK
ncbi:IS66 family insertion sequence element accessory protein TnpB [Clostridium felsineum]|uniref:IS66 family insertion sequence element accessory protein TnpA n=1 Tax=Clostridium felsineum TaxID=36839 RepID=UPI00214DA292|nr:IS66 family insertion sequence element accessory protein TnpB [Clostridium felsineum]MCR3758477.1 IS66 family insertion sequence element accessory protein TnpB [Clostridium felsineum]